MSLQVTSTTSFTHCTEPSFSPPHRNRFCLFSLQHGFLTADEQYTHRPENAHQLCCFEVACQQARLLQPRHPDLMIRDVRFQLQGNKWVSFSG